jgi:hypothetical protein
MTPPFTAGLLPAKLSLFSTRSSNPRAKILPVAGSLTNSRQAKRYNGLP